MFTCDRTSGPSPEDLRRGGVERTHPFPPPLCSWCVIGQLSASHWGPAHRVCPPPAVLGAGKQQAAEEVGAGAPELLETQARGEQGAWQAGSEAEEARLLPGSRAQSGPGRPGSSRGCEPPVAAVRTHGAPPFAPNFLPCLSSVLVNS